MDHWNLVLCAVFGCLVGLARSQSTTRCSMLLRNGGVCVGIREACPVGMFEYDLFSNFVGCFRPDRKCCAANPEGVVKNPAGVVPIPPKTCGVGSLEPSSRILDGAVTAPCDWPFVVSIRGLLRSSDTLNYDTTSHVCQGVLIGLQWVLTSPVCILSAGNSVQDAPSRILVVAGEYNVSGVDIDPVTLTQQEQLLRISNVYIHPDHELTTLEQVDPFNDTYLINSNAVALLKLAEPIRGRCSGIACLPTATEATNDCATYDECIITGWGFSKGIFDGGLRGELLQGRVRLSSLVACDYLTRRLGLTSFRPRGTTCQTPRDRITDACLGDEGGAVLCSNGYSWVVRGILPFNLCKERQYNLYVTNLAPHLNWIQSTMNNSATTTQTG